MRRRVALMMALVVDLKILLMDEPFGALDTHTRTRLHQSLLSPWRHVSSGGSCTGVPSTPGAERSRDPLHPGEEVRALLQPVRGMPRLMAHLLYGAGLRLLECCRLRIQDVDFAANQIVVRTGKGEKDRSVIGCGMLQPLPHHTVPHDPRLNYS